MRFVVLMLAVFALAGCVSTDYLGKSYAPTTHVDLYFDPADIKKEYEVMGELTAEAELGSAEEMQEKIMEEAMKKGADGVLLGGLDKVITGESTSSDTTTKDQGRKTTSTTTVSTSYSEKKVIKARLIKYKQPS